MLWTCLLAQTREMNLCCIQAVCPVVCEGGVSNVQTPLSVSCLLVASPGSIAGLQPWLAHCCLLIQLCCPCLHVTWLSFSHPLPLGPYCPLGIPTSIRVSELNSNPGISKSMPWLPPLSPSALGRSILISQFPTCQPYIEDWDQGRKQALVPARKRQTLCSAVAAIESNAEEAGKHLMEEQP